MIALKFVVKKDFVLQDILKSYSHYPPFWKLKKKAWEIDPHFYQILSQNLEALIIEEGLERGVHAGTANVDKNLATLYRTPQFTVSFRQAERYGRAVESQWKKNYASSLRHLSDITGIDLSKIDREITIYISHPRLSHGRSYLEEHAITWSHPDEWKNYATVYLWHEIMHHVTADTRWSPHLMHSLIELACDNELRIRLNGGGAYFKEKGIPMGHRYLVGLNKKLLPDWKKYLRSRDENIYQFEKRMRRKWRGEKLVRMPSALGWWAEWH